MDGKKHLNFLFESNENNSLKNLCSYVLKIKRNFFFLKIKIKRIGLLVCLCGFPLNDIII